MAQTMIRGTGSAFLTTTGRPRIATMEGKTYVVGRGKATRVADMTAAQALLTERVNAEKAKRESKRAKVVVARDTAAAIAAPAAAAEGLVVGAVVGFTLQGSVYRYGRVTEIGPRSVAILYRGRDTFRRAAQDVDVQPLGDYCDTCSAPCPGLQCCDKCAEAEVRP
jgi:hypothetical protein